MAQVVKVQEAKTRLSALLAEVESGSEIVIARGDVPVARLVPIAKPGPRAMGFVAYRVPATFFDPLPEEELATWES
ncbi:type II toxin-antitoxin system Phd/YefM family antitoxin [Mycolicibacterium sp. HS_4_1]